MGKLDELLSSGSEDYRTLTVRVTSDVADNLKVKAKKLGIPRTKLVQTLFEEGLDKLTTIVPGAFDNPVESAGTDPEE